MSAERAKPQEDLARWGSQGHPQRPGLEQSEATGSMEELRAGRTSGEGGPLSSVGTTMVRPPCLSDPGSEVGRLVTIHTQEQEE